MRRAATAALAVLIASAPATAQIPQPDIASPVTVTAPDHVPDRLRGSVAELRSSDAAWDRLAPLDVVRLVDVPVSAHRTATLLLHRIDPFASGARVVTARIADDGSTVEQEIARPSGQWWTGMVEGEPGSKAMLSRSAAGILGFVQDSHGQSVIASDRAGGGGPTIAYELHELPPDAIDWSAWACEALPNPDRPAVGAVQPRFTAQPCRQLRLAMETDNEFYQRFAGAPDPSAAASAYVATILAGMRAIYQQDLQILPAATWVRLWPTAADPWSGSNTPNQLYELRSYWATNMAGVPRDVVQMLSARGLGGGIAWLNASCTEYGYSVCGNLAGSFPYPLSTHNGGNWDIVVTTHELGHNCGTPHTHDFCPTPPDSCAPSGYFGQCQTAQVCTSNGTIMSYCHLCSGGMANIDLTFHQLCIDAIGLFMTTTCNRTADATDPVSVDDLFLVPRGSPADLDPLANEVLVNCDRIDFDSLPATTGRGGTLTRLWAAGPGGRDLVRYVPPAGFSGDDAFVYKVRDTSGAISGKTTATLRVITLRDADGPVGDVPGLASSFYALNGPSSLPDFSTLAPYATSTAPDVNYPSTDGEFAGSGRADNVGAVWTGWLLVDQPGTYTLSTNSDDGSRLLIGSTVVVSNDGLHAMVEASGTISLAAGKHALRIEFFEAGGGAGCIASIEGPGLSKAPIAAARLSHGGTVNRADVNADGRVNGADIGLVLSAWGTAGGAADVNRDGIVNGADIGALLSAWAP
jgi:PA14 domain/Metallo-peptidase family M12/Bacterial Ig domain